MCLTEHIKSIKEHTICSEELQGEACEPYHTIMPRGAASPLLLMPRWDLTNIHLKNNNNNIIIII